MQAKLCVLVIDGDSESATELAGILTSGGYVVRRVTGAEEAVAAAAEPPHLLLAAINGPGGNGVETCRRLKSDERTRDLPVICISTAGVQERVDGFALGAADVIVRPFLPEELLARVRIHIDLCRLRTELESQVAQRTNVLRVALQRLEDEVADRKRAELALRQSEELNRLAMQAGRTYAFELNPATGEVRRSYNCADILGITGDATRETWEQCIQRVHPDDRETFRGRLAELRPGADLGECDYRLIGGDGRIVYVHAVLRALFDERGNVSRFIGIVADATRTRQAEAALHESEGRFRNMADTAPVMICTSGPDKLAYYFNKAWLAFTGRALSQELNFGWTESVHPDDLDRCLVEYSSSFDARQKCHLEYRLRRSDGEYRWIVFSGLPRFTADGEFRGYIASAIDITDLKRAQEETFDRQKLESLRVLTGGIAHDFNNLLGSILVETELAETELAENVSPLDAVCRIRAIARRAAEIVRQLMIYSGQDTATVETLNISSLVKEMLELLKVSICKQAILETDLRSGLPNVVANAAQIRQVVMNLILNASEAMEGREGWIRVSTSAVELSESAGSDGEAGQQRDSIRLEIADSGFGISEEAKSRIFEPFFTTKPNGHGLGLSVVQGIVHSHGGAIRVNSTPGSGTVFEVLLPCVSRPTGRGVWAGSADSRTHRERGTVLLVEDEDSLRVAVGKTLRRRGFSLLATGDGRAAVDIFRAQPSEIGAVVLDLILPGLSGVEVLKQIHMDTPSVPVIITSAHDRDGAARRLSEQPYVSFLRKPYRIEELIQCLQTFAGSTVPGTEAGAATAISMDSLLPKLQPSDTGAGKTD
jgi:PAS domain S-box-containing protein